MNHVHIRTILPFLYTVVLYWVVLFSLKKASQEPELALFVERGGTLFLFGPPGDPQYFKWGRCCHSLSASLSNLCRIVVPRIGKYRFIAISYFLHLGFDDEYSKEQSGESKVQIKYMRTIQTLSSSTQYMARKMFQVFLVQVSSKTRKCSKRKKRNDFNL